MIKPIPTKNWKYFMIYLIMIIKIPYIIIMELNDGPLLLANTVNLLENVFLDQERF